MTVMQPEVDFEEEEMRRLAILHKVIRRILRGYWSLLVGAFVLFLGAGIALLALETRNSPDRFETRVNLLYLPKPSLRVRPLDDRSLAQIFSRYVMYRKLGEELHFDREALPELMRSIEVIQNKRQSTLYTIIVRDNHPEGAIRKANAFADLCIREYIAFRTHDLKKHQEVMRQRRIALQDSLAKLRDEEGELGRRIMASSPLEELLRLQRAAADLKNSLGETRIRAANEETRLKGLRQQLAKVNPAVPAHLRRIRQFLSELDRLDLELLSESQIYGEANPRILGKRAYRAAVARCYAEFLRQHAIASMNRETLESLEELTREAAESALRLRKYSDRVAALEQTLEVNDRQLDRVLKVLPAFKDLENRRRILQDTSAANEELLAELAYLQASSPNEIMQMERSSTVVGKPLFAQRNLLLALAIAMLLTGMLMALVLSLELFFGKVSGWQEISLYPELNLLGFLPPDLAMLGDRGAVNAVLDALYYHLQAAAISGKVIFAGSLPGGTELPETAERIEWNFSLSGRRLFRLRIVKFAGDEQGGGDFLPENISRRGDSGTLQAGNVDVLAPPELRLLRDVLEKLQSEYDLIVIRREEPLKRNGVFLSQMAEFCAGAVIAVGAGATPRSMLWSLVNFAGESRMKILTIVSGENNVKQLTRKENH